MVKRIIVIISLILSLLLISCRTQGETAAGTADSFPADEPGQEGRRGWKELYFETMEHNPSATHITLIDVDFDQIPELFLSQLGAHNASIYSGYSYKDGVITDIVFTDEFMPVDLELYRDKKTGELIWLAAGEFRDGSVYEHSWMKVDFTEFSDVRQSLFWGWKETLEGEGILCKTSCRILGEYEDGPKVTEDEVSRLKKEVFSDYERIGQLSMFSFTDAFLREKGAEKAFDKELFLAFAGLYESTCEENDGAGKDGKFPIYSIVNFNLLNEYENMAEYPLSVTRQNYSRFDQEKMADISVGFVQINEFPDRQIKEKINNRLKEEAFGQWDVEEEQRLELSVYQVPSFYKNYLSVRRWTDCYFMDSVYPRADLSAVTFDMRTGQEVNLTDVLAIDDSLREKIYSGMFSDEKFTHEECLNIGIYDKLWNVLENEESNLKPVFYLTEYGRVGLILGVPHVMGDYLAFEAPLAEVNQK